MWRFWSLVAVILIACAVGAFFLWQSLRPAPAIQVNLRSEHSLITSAELDTTVVDAFLEKIQFREEKNYYLVDEEIRVPRQDLEIFEDTIHSIRTNSPPLSLANQRWAK